MTVHVTEYLADVFGYPEDNFGEFEDFGTVVDTDVDLMKVVDIITSGNYFVRLTNVSLGEGYLVTWAGPGENDSIDIVIDVEDIGENGVYDLVKIIKTSSGRFIIHADCDELYEITFYAKNPVDPF